VNAPCPAPSRTSTYAFDGAGTSNNNRTTPSDLVTFLRGIATTPWGRAIHDGMAVLGVDGSQAQNGIGTPAAGHVRIKDGDTIAGTAAGQLVALATTQTGYIDARSGRRLVYSLLVNNIPFTSIDDYVGARADIASIVVAIQQGY
jgi:D-alanyl-D-alanine carboxypeptidase